MDSSAYAYLDIEDIYCQLETSSKGLALEQVDRMKKAYGSNISIDNSNDSICYRLRRAFINPFTVILFVLAMVSFITDVLLTGSENRSFTTFIIILTMILLSGVIRFVQEMRSKRASERLKRLVHTTVEVKREGILLGIPAEELVVGDCVILSAGDRIPADIRLVHASDLFVSQAAITGESAIIEKFSNALEKRENISTTQLTNMAFMGTTVISGSGFGIVVGVSKDTLYGTIDKEKSSVTNSFEKGANSIAWVMIRFMAILVPVVFIISGITKGRWGESFLFALSVAVGLTPEMLPMILTACLARGSISMSRKQTIIKDINAMQGFGSMDVLCVDKTGTLTNECIVLEYYMDPLGNESSEVLELGYINSLYHSGVKNPIDNAILRCREMPDKQTYYEDLAKKFAILDEKPFDYDTKYVSTLITDKEDHKLEIIKGEIHEVVSKCRYVEIQGQVKEIDSHHKNSVDAIVEEMLEDGMKVIAIAKRAVTSAGLHHSDMDFVLMGYLVFFDAPKKTAVQSIATLKELHVTTKILTGDYLQIALSIARRIGIQTQNVLTGTQMEEMSEDELLLAAEEVTIFAELTPMQKVKIVNVLRENGHTVGFLGDGVNDVPAIAEADVGISVDTAVDAAKDVADVVLLEKDLNVLNDGIIEGRKTFTNMAKYIKITASSNFGNIFSIVCASALLPFLPITAIQILSLNLLYDILCMVLPWDHVDKEEYVTPREWSGKALGRFMLYFGPMSSIFDILTFLFLYFVLCPSLCGGMLYSEITDAVIQGRYIALFQTGWFLESMWSQVLIIHMLRTQKTSWKESMASIPVFAITLAGIVLFTGLTFTGAAGLLGLTKLPMWYFGFLFVTVLLYMLSTTIVKKWYIHKYQELV